jgi:hypothetical protein
LFLLLVAAADKPAVAGETQQEVPGLYPFRAEGPDEKWGYINSGGTVVVEPAYRRAADFVAGRARVTRSEETGYINEDGKWVFTLPKGWAATRPFSGGLAGFSVGDMYSGKWGYLDRNGTIIVQPEYDQIGEFVEGVARVNIGAKWEFPGVWEGGRWGFIDKSGRVVVPIQFDFAYDFSAGRASVKKHGRWFYIDLKGGEVLDPKADESNECPKEDLPQSHVRDVDGTMKRTNDREAFRGELARVHIGGRFLVEDDGGAEWMGGAWYYVNRKGEIVRKVRSDDAGQGCGYGRESR